MGREILRALLTDKRYAAVHCVGRRPLTLQHPKLRSHVVDFAALKSLPRTDDVFIALGTTIQVAGSQAAFRAVDFDAVVAVASAARSSGATCLGVVSAMGANPASRIFYNRVKGDMEHAVRGLGYASLVFARPSLLVGNRDSLNQAPRAAEKISQTVMALLRPVIPANLRAITASDVALSLIAAVEARTPAVQVLLSGALQRH